MAQILVYADEELKRAVGQVADLEERSISQVVRRWIREGLERWEQTKRISETTQISTQKQITKQIN